MSLEERLKKRVQAGLGTGTEAGPERGSDANQETPSIPVHPTVGPGTAAPIAPSQPPAPAAGDPWWVAPPPSPRWFIPGLFTIGYAVAAVILFKTALVPWNWSVVNSHGQLLYVAYDLGILAWKLGGLLTALALTILLVLYLFRWKQRGTPIPKAAATVGSASLLNPRFSVPTLRKLAYVTAFEAWGVLSWNLVTLTLAQFPANSPTWFNVIMGGILPIVVSYLTIYAAVRFLKRLGRTAPAAAKSGLPAWMPQPFEGEKVTASGFPPHYRRYFPEKSSRELQADHFRREREGTFNRLANNVAGFKRPFGI